MRLFVNGFLLVLLSGGFTCRCLADGEFERVNGIPVAPGRVLIRLADGEKACADSIRNIGFTLVREFELARAQMWLAPKDLPVARAMRIARRLPGVASVEPDYVRAISAQEPNDPSLLEQYAIAKMQMPQAWELTTGGSGVVVAVIDSGVQYDHNDLAANMYTNSSEKLDGIDNDGIDNDGNGYVDDIRGWDFLCGSFSNMGQDNDPADIFGHGTQVAGVIGAVANNAVGITGVAWQVHILPLKIGGDPSLPFLSSVAAIEAIEYAVAQGAKVINASYIGHSYSHFEADSLVGFSNFGGKTVDLAAPGYQIYTTTASATPTAPHSHRRKWRASRCSCGRCFPGWACATCG